MHKGPRVPTRIPAPFCTTAVNHLSINVAGCCAVRTLATSVSTNKFQLNLDFSTVLGLTGKHPSHQNEELCSRYCRLVAAALPNPLEALLLSTSAATMLPAITFPLPMRTRFIWDRQDTISLPAPTPSSGRAHQRQRLVYQALQQLFPQQHSRHSTPSNDGIIFDLSRVNGNPGTETGRSLQHCFLH